jgi:micrococcal nuclease
MNYPQPWWYRANVSPLSKWPNGIYDGDTVELMIDQGFQTYTHRKCRLLAVDTPEMRGYQADNGKVARRAVVLWMAAATIGAGDWPLLVRTHEADSFGRWLVEIIRKTDGQNLSDFLIGLGYGHEY